MSQPSQFERPRLLLLSHDLIFNSVHSKNIQSKLVELINKGYDKPRFKYNIIKTARIKVSLGADLEIEDKKTSTIGLCLHHDPAWTKDHNIVFKAEDIDVKMVDDSQFDITDDIYKQVIGSVGLKPFDEDSMEVTALTSFYPKIGSALVRAIENYMVTQMPHKKLYAHVIMDHELVPFYSKLGFNVVETTLVEIDPVTGKTIGSDLEDGIEASKSFSLALMNKVLGTAD